MQKEEGKKNKWLQKSEGQRAGWKRSYRGAVSEHEGEKTLPRGDWWLGTHAGPGSATSAVGDNFKF